MKKKRKADFYSGLSGLLVPIPKYRFPPPFENASRLTYYASLYNSIEINSSFYKIPQPATVERWAESVPSNFKFTFKLWRGITHEKGFRFKEEDIEKFLQSINAVSDKDKQGCLLIQLPPSVGKTQAIQLEKLLEILRKKDTGDWKIAVEFRNASWYDPSTYTLLDSHKVALVVHDMPKSATPLIAHKSDFMYVRFHGPTGNYRDTYPDDFLSEYSIYVLDWMTDGKDVYMYFNNTVGDATNNTRTITDMIHQSRKSMAPVKKPAAKKVSKPKSKK